MNNPIFIFTEAGEGIGFGHMMRCHALSLELTKNGYEVQTFLNRKGEVILPDEKIKINDWLDEDFLSLNSSELKGSIVIVDSYLAGASQYKKLKTYFSRIIIIDDYNRLVYPEADIIINPGIWGDKMDYSNQSARIAGGKNYIILRYQFLKYRDSFLVKEKIRTIGITMGGSDYRDLIPGIINYLSKNKSIEKVLVFAGSEDYKTQLSKTTDSKVVLWGFLDAEQMAQTLLKCDLVISAAGQTLNELAFLGIPTVAVCIDSDQEYNLLGYNSNGFIYTPLYWDQKDLLSVLENEVISLSDHNARSKLHKTGQAIVYGNGPENIVKLIS